VTTEKRRRQLAREKYERQQARRAASSDRRRTRQRIIAAVVVGVLVIGIAAWVVVGRMQPVDEAAVESTPAASPASSPAASAIASAAAGAAASAAAAALTCRDPGTPRADDMSYAKAPAPSAAPSGPAPVITLTTNCGDIAIATLPDKAPLTVASETFLARDGFYNRTSCHRLTTTGIYVLQCGDPTGDGTGGPGFSLPDENLPAADGVNYPAGTVAMANAGPGTSGSQFFIVYRDTTLPPGYTIWGTVTKGLDIVTGVAAAGVEGGLSDGTPVQPVFIESAAVSPG